MMHVLHIFQFLQRSRSQGSLFKTVIFTTLCYFRPYTGAVNWHRKWKYILSESKYIVLFCAKYNGRQLKGHRSIKPDFFSLKITIFTRKSSWCTILKKWPFLNVKMAKWPNLRYANSPWLKIQVPVAFEPRHRLKLYLQF